MRGDSAACSGTRKRFGIAGEGGTSTSDVTTVKRPEGPFYNEFGDRTRSVWEQ